MRQRSLGSRRRLAVAAATLLAVGGVLGWWGAASNDAATNGDEGTTPAPVATNAVEVCQSARQFDELIATDAPASQVTAVLDQMAKDSTRVADADPRFRSLSSGIQALQFAVRHNDGEAARVGILVVRSECSRLSES